MTDETTTTAEVNETETPSAPKKAAKKPAKKAPKKAAKKAAKPAKKAAAAGAPRGHKYELTAKGEKLDPKETFREGSQYTVIFKYLKRKPMSVRELSEIPGIAKEMETTQDPIRPIAFICNKLKNDGVLKFAA